MSAPKFTPGPWAHEIVPSDAAERAMPQSEWSGLYIGPEGDDPPGRISHTIFEGGFAHGLKDGDPEADARLMTAAPDLHAVAASFDRFMTGICPAGPQAMSPSIGPFAALRDLWLYTRDALAKAEGGTT